MYPFIRLGTHAIKSAVRKQRGHALAITDTSEITLTANLSDIDHFVEMNMAHFYLI